MAKTQDFNKSIKDLNVGVIALVLNVVVMAAVSAATRTAGRPDPAPRIQPEATAGAG